MGFREKCKRVAKRLPRALVNCIPWVGAGLDHLIWGSDAGTSQPPGRPPASEAPPVPSGKTLNLPALRNPYFTGREKELEQLHQTLGKDRAAALSQN